MKVGQGLAGIVVQTGQALTIGDYKNWTAKLDMPPMRDVGRAMAVPLRQGEQVIGSLNIFDQQVGDFPPNALQILETFAAYAAVAIRNAQLFSAAQSQSALAETLRDVGRIVGSSLDLIDVLNLMLEQLERVVPYDAAHFMLLDDDQNSHMVAARRYVLQDSQLGFVVPLDRLKLSKEAIETNTPLVVGDTQELPNFNPTPPEARIYRSLLLIPIITPTRAVGILTVLHTTPYQYGTAAQQIAEQFAQQVVMAVENARLHDELKQANIVLEQRVATRTAELAHAKEATEQQLVQLATLTNITQAVSRATDLRAALQTMDTQLTQLLQAKFTVVGFINEQRQELIVPPLRRAGAADWVLSLNNLHAVQIMLQTQEPLIISRVNAGELLGHYAGDVVTADLAFSLLVPLVVRGQIIGIIAVNRTLPSPDFTTADVQLAKTVAAQVASFIEQLRLVEREYEARVAAEEANQSKSTFLANMSHELRTPLNSVLGFAQLLQRNAIPHSEDWTHLGIIQTSGEHLLELINEILDMSKIEAGHMTLNPTPCLVPKLLENMADMFTPRAAAKELTFAIERHTALPDVVLVDERRLRQVLINLLENSIKFTTHGGVRLYITAEQTPAATLLRFTVADTGVGMAAEELPLLFRPFTQTRTGRRTGQGTGLGLALSQQLVQFMGGEITVASTLGKGSEFQFYLPVSEVVWEPAEAAAEARPITGLVSGQTAYRLLIAEDRWENALLLQQVLAPLGLPLRVVTNGEEAVAVWQQWRPHLILMDMQMPIMDGYEATQRIKAQATATAESPTPRIIALTASAYEEERSIILANGCDDFMSKPLNVTELFAMLSKHLGLVYTYGPPPTAAPHTPNQLAGEPAELAAVDMRPLPQPWLMAMHHAATAADQRQMSNLIAQIAAEFPTQAQQLRALVGRFATPTILQQLEYALGQAP